MTESTGITYDRACVLLSGGLDSVAALHYALRAYKEVRAISFRYGQPHQNAELACAARVAGLRHVTMTTLALADTLLTGDGFMRSVRDHDPSKFGGENEAFVPGRNAVFMSIAASHASTWWRGGNWALVFGANADDASGFADCRMNPIAQLTIALRFMCSRQLIIDCPFIKMTKADILARFADSPIALDDIQRSWSCYRGNESGPCHKCTACVSRDDAFLKCGIDDMSEHPKMCGGDPQRGPR